MQNKMIVLFLLLTGFFASGFAQVKVNNEDLEKIGHQLSDSLPNGWSVKTNTDNKNEFVIQSPVIQLNGAMDSNDPITLKDHCEIFILVVSRVAPDSIISLRKRNKELKDKLPPQNSKDNLKKWYEENEQTLIILDAEPTHYDDNYSYRIKCRRLPYESKDLANYNKVMNHLNYLFHQY